MENNNKQVLNRKSKLDELIQQYCPNGVERKSIGSVIERVREKQKDNLDITQVYVVTNSIGIVKAEEYRENTVHSDDISNYTVLRSEMVAYNPSRLNIGSIAVLHSDVPGLVSPMYVVFSIDDSLVNVKYFEYYIHSSYVRYKINSYKEEGARFRFDFDRWDWIDIPIPPLPVQEEIVRILDRFTELEAELEAELLLRKKQYEWYRDQLLTFRRNGETDVPLLPWLQRLLDQYAPNGVEWKKLGEVLRIKNGSDYKQFGHGNVPVYGSGGIMTYVDTYVYDKPSVLIPRKGSLDKLYYVDVPFWNVDTIFYTEIDESIVVPKYIYYCLAKAHLERLNKAGGVPSLTQDILNKVVLPVPPLVVQELIVSILDKFVTIVTDISSGLPAEIEARHKQYEFYRDKLLSFDNV